MTLKAFLLALALMTLVGGCDADSANGELSDKSEYSVLQRYEYEYREVKQDLPFMIFKHALKTNLTVLAFPVRDKPVGYVVIIARSNGVSKVKAMDGVEFKVSKLAYAAVKSEADISPEVDNFIKARIL